MEVHSLSNRPTSAWEELSKSQKVIKIKTKTPTKGVPDDKVHCKNDWLKALKG